MVAYGQNRLECRREGNETPLQIFQARWMTGLKEEEDVIDWLQMRCVKPADAVESVRENGEGQGGVDGFTQWMCRLTGGSPCFW